VVKRIKGRAPLDGDDARSGKTRRRSLPSAPNNRPGFPFASKAAAMNALIARLACSLAVAAGVAALPAAKAQGSNAGKPMHIVVTFTPGGAPDILARLIGEKLSVAWS
jgi:hypothetical protein